MGRMRALTIRAGGRARARLREGGIHAEDVAILVGASGGPKWLVLNGLDRYLFGELFSGREQPLHAMGSSIGCWRAACFAQPDPLAALDRFEEAYITQAYPPKPPPDLISARSREILRELLGPDGAESIVSHPWLVTHVLTTRCRRLPGIDDRRAQAALLGVGALLNAVDRRLMGLPFERVIWSGEPDWSPLRQLRDLPTRRLELTRDNVEDALMATASIPLVLAPVQQPAGGPRGPYLDGGVVDYHPGFDLSQAGGLVLYPHFFDRLTPAWFDKPFTWRRPPAAALEDVVLVAPSPAFVAGLPGGKIPDRTDFQHMADGERIRVWREVVRRSRALAEDFVELVEGGRVSEGIGALG